MPSGICECGCGQATQLCTHTVALRGVVKGQPLRFVAGHAGFTRRRSTMCPKGHSLSGDNAIYGKSKGISPFGKPYRQGLKCRICAHASQSRLRATPLGKANRVVDSLRRFGLRPEELELARQVAVEFFSRQRSEQNCPICGDNCSGKKQTAADHCHRTLCFRAIICQACNVALGAARERAELLGNGKLGNYLKLHKEKAYAVGQS
jgi:hypothetical protein